LRDVTIGATTRHALNMSSLVRTHRKLRFSGDSPLEGTGFELLVPRREARDFVRQGGRARAPYTPYSLENVHDRGGDGIGADHVAGKGNRTRPDLH
jgi:hypothetical protein